MKTSFVLLALSLPLVGANPVDARKVGAATAAAGATGSIDAPSLGRIVTADGEIQMLSGVPQASSIRTVGSIAGSVRQARLSPSQSWILAEGLAGAGLMMRAADADSPWQPIAGSIAKADLYAFSPRGRYAVVYEASSRQLQRIANARVDRTWRELPFEPVALAISDAGDVAAAASQDVYQLAGEQPVLLYRTASPAITFLADDQDTLLVADFSTADGASIATIAQATTAPDVRVHRVASEVRSSAVMLAPSLDGGALLAVFADSANALCVALRNSSSELAFDAQWIALPAKATMLQRLRVGDSFVITAPDRGGEPAWWISMSSGAQGRALQVLFATPVSEGEGNRQ